MAGPISSLPLEMETMIASHLFANLSVHISSSPGDGAIHNYPGSRHRTTSTLLHPYFYIIRRQQSPSAVRLLYYAKLTLTFNIHETFRSDGLSQWLRQAGDQGVKMMKRFIIRWSDYVDIQIDLDPESSMAEDGCTCVHNPDAPDASRQPSKESASERRDSVIDSVYSKHDALWNTDLQQCAYDSSTYVLCEKYRKREAALVLALKDVEIGPRTTSDHPLSRRSGSKHSVAVKAVTGRGWEQRWAQMGTTCFCGALAEITSHCLEASLASRPKPYLSIAEIEHLVNHVSDRAAALKWLWYW